jgi:hypothetical protein
MKMPIEIEQLITAFVYGTKLTFLELTSQMDHVLAVQNSIDFIFLSPVTYCLKSKVYVPNPYREGYPFHALNHLHKPTIFSEFMVHVPEFLSDAYFKNRYRGVLSKKLVKLQNTGFTAWNKLFFTFFVHLTEKDFKTDHRHFFKYFDELNPISL